MDRCWSSKYVATALKRPVESNVAPFDVFFLILLNDIMNSMAITTVWSSKSVKDISVVVSFEVKSSVPKVWPSYVCAVRVKLNLRLIWSACKLTTERSEMITINHCWNYSNVLTVVDPNTGTKLAENFGFSKIFYKRFIVNFAKFCKIRSNCHQNLPEKKILFEVLWDKNVLIRSKKIPKSKIPLFGVPLFEVPTVSQIN